MSDRGETRRLGVVDVPRQPLNLVRGLLNSVAQGRNLRVIPSMPSPGRSVPALSPAPSTAELQDQLVAKKIGLPIIVITGHADVPLCIRAFEGGDLDPFGEQGGDLFHVLLFR